MLSRRAWIHQDPQVLPLHQPEDGQWTNVNKWMCENGYTVPYVGQNKKDVEELHMINRQKLVERDEV